MESSKTRHIGKAGELLVQYILIKHGIDSSPMTTDAGVDLVAYSPKSSKALTIQVKTQEKPTPAGGKGKLATGWYLRENSPVELIAVVVLSLNSVWLFSLSEFYQLAQQHSAKGTYQLYMYVDETIKSNKEMVLMSHFEPYLMRNRINNFF